MFFTARLNWSHQLSSLPSGTAAAAVRQRRLSVCLSCASQLHIPPALQLFAAAAAFPVLKSKLPLSLAFHRLTSSLTSPWALGSSASLGLTSALATSCHASSLPPANVAGKGLLLTSLGFLSLPLGPSGPCHV